jgi:signal transduction histidine kinase
MAEQQASLRRLAMLVASGAAAEDVFAAIALEVAQVFRSRLVQIFRWEPDGTATVVGTWGDGANPFPVGSNWPWHEPGLAAVAERARAGAAIRVADLGHLRGTVSSAGSEAGIGSAAGAPIIVGGEPWGLIGVGVRRGEDLPEHIEERLADFTALISSAVASTATREQLARLADEQAALRRVATLVARGAPPADVFEAVTAELGRLLRVGSTGLVRFEEDDTATVIAGWGRLGEVVPIGRRLPLGGTNVISKIARTGRPARLDDYERAASGHIADRAHRLETGAAVGGPIVVAGRLWGAMIAAALGGDVLPPDTEPRLEQFTELIATAIGNTEARVELARLADEQDALRRVATLVAEEPPLAQLLPIVADEVASVLGPHVNSTIMRFEGGDTAAVVAVGGEQPEGGMTPGLRLPIEGSSVASQTFRERRVIRVDDYAAADGAIADRAREHGIRTAVGSPILVQGRSWGAMVVGRRDTEPFPAGAERRILQFTRLVSTAIANAEAHAELQRLLDEQAALRRVATLVAKAAAPTDVFDAVIVEVGRLLGAARVGMMRAEGATEVTIVAHRGQQEPVRIGLRLPVDGDSVTARVLRTGRSARLNHYETTHGTIADLARRNAVTATVGAPITVDGRLWGVITASWTGEEDATADAEERLAEFAGLLETAIANAHGRDQVMASRARVLTAGDEARRRLVRDLHDGAQQRLVHAIITLKLAQRALEEDAEHARPLLAEALEYAEQGNAELRELSHGILPAALTRGGLGAGIDALASRVDLPVHAEIEDMRLPPEIEASAYFIVAEALTNVVKHAQAQSASISATVDGGTLRLEIRDDGIGGADPQGHGLLGLGDRAAALGGRLRVESPRGGGTVVTAQLPLLP